MNNKIYQILLSLAITITLIGIVLISNKENIVIDFNSSFLALVGSLIGLLLSFLFRKKVTDTAKKKIFLTYNINDIEFARELSDDLKKNNLIVFNENEIVDLGDTLDARLKKYISISDHIFVVLSSNTYKSKFLKNEIEFAKKHNKTIVPILKDNIDIPSFLSNYKFADFRKNYSNSLQQLLKSM